MKARSMLDLFAFTKFTSCLALTRCLMHDAVRPYISLGGTGDGREVSTRPQSIPRHLVKMLVLNEWGCNLGAQGAHYAVSLTTRAQHPILFGH